LGAPSLEHQSIPNQVLVPHIGGSYLIPTRHCGYSLPAQAICNNLAVIVVNYGPGSKHEGIDPWQL
jgi:hypothetical protein